MTRALPLLVLACATLPPYTLQERAERCRGVVREVIEEICTEECRHGPQGQVGHPTGLLWSFDGDHQCRCMPDDAEEPAPRVEPPKTGVTMGAAP